MWIVFASVVSGGVFLGGAKCAWSLRPEASRNQNTTESRSIEPVPSVSLYTLGNNLHRSACKEAEPWTELAPELINQINQHKFTPLHATVRCANLEKTQKLLEHRAVAQHDGRTCWTQMWLPCIWDNFWTQSTKGDTPMHALALLKEADTAKPLLLLLKKHGGSLDALNAKKLSPLGVAAQYNHWQVAELLVNSGADPAAGELRGLWHKMGLTPLHIAAQKGHYSLARFLVTRINGDKINLPTPDTGDTALHLAMQHGYVHTVRALLHHGGAAIRPSVKAKNFKGQVPMDFLKNLKPETKKRMEITMKYSGLFKD